MSERLANDLWEAVDNDDFDRVKTLLELGADPNHQKYWNRDWWKKRHGGWNARPPPAHTACGNGNLNMLKLLVQHGADISKGDASSNWTVLHHACWGGHKELVVYLTKEAGCKVDVRDNYSQTPLHCACAGGNSNVVKYLVEDLNCDVDVRTLRDKTPLHKACKGGHKAVVQYLVDHKCDVDVKDIDKKTPIHYACSRGFKDIAQYLVQEGRCDVDVTDRWGCTPLDTAIREGKTEIFRYLKSLLQSSMQPGAVTHEEVVKVAKNASARWLDLGIELNIEVDTLEKIGKENKFRVDDCFSAMVKHWVKQGTPTWSELAEALVSNVIGRQDIADTIQLQYKVEKAKSPKNDSFTLKEVRKVTWETRSEWRNIGIQLGVDADTLQVIASNNPKNAGGCYTDMLINWFRQPSSETPLSWSSVIQALRSDIVKRGDIASHIKEYYTDQEK